MQVGGRADELGIRRNRQNALHAFEVGGAHVLKALDEPLLSDALQHGLISQGRRCRYHAWLPPRSSTSSALDSLAGAKGVKCLRPGASNVTRTLSILFAATHPCQRRREPTPRSICTLLMHAPGMHCAVDTVTQI